MLSITLPAEPFSRLFYFGRLSSSLKKTPKARRLCCPQAGYPNTDHIRGVARIFQKGVHSRDIIRGSPTIYGLYRCSPSYISGLSRIIAAWRPILTKDKSRWRKYFTKKQILKKWAFQQWLLRPRYCHGVFATWILQVVCSKEGLPSGDHGYPRPPLPPLATPLNGASRG